MPKVHRFQTQKSCLRNGLPRKNFSQRNQATGAVVAGPIDNWQDGADASNLNSIGPAPTDPKDAANTS